MAVRNDFVAAFANILQVLPDTKTVAVVIGASPLEKFWMEEVKRDLKSLEDRLSLVWYSHLSFDQILKRASELPQHTVLFWGLMSVDAAGIVHEGNIALQQLHAVANAPIFSYQEPFFGGSTVGGPMHLVAATSSKTVNAVIQYSRAARSRRTSNIRADRIWAAEI